MKYNIYVNQKVLSKTNLDLIDGAIIDYLKFLCLSVNKKIDSKRINGFTWIDYKKLLEDNPLLKIKHTSAISRRIQKIKEAGFIQTLEKRVNGHKHIYFKVTSMIDLLEYEPSDIKQQDSESLMIESEKPNVLKQKPNVLKQLIKTTSNNTIKDTGRDLLINKKDYLLNVPKEDIEKFLQTYNVGKSQIVNKAEQLYNWCEANGKTKKNYRAFLQVRLL